MPKSVAQIKKDFVALIVRLCSYVKPSRHVVTEHKMASENEPSQQVDPFLRLA
jgi:hypothetical protein